METATQQTQDLHSASFTNSYNEQCSVTLQFEMHTSVSGEYNVRTSKRSLSRTGGLTEVTTVESVESFSSYKQAARAYNWALYRLAASAADSAAHSLPLT